MRGRAERWRSQCEAQQGHSDQRRNEIFAHDGKRVKVDHASQHTWNGGPVPSFLPPFARDREARTAQMTLRLVSSLVHAGNAVVPGKIVFIDKGP